METNLLQEIFMSNFVLGDCPFTQNYPNKVRHRGQKRSSLHRCSLALEGVVMLSGWSSIMPTAGSNCGSVWLRMSRAWSRADSVTIGPSILAKSLYQFSLSHHCAFPCLFPLTMWRYALERHFLWRCTVRETLSTLSFNRRPKVSEGDNALLPCTALNRPHTKGPSSGLTRGRNTYWVPLLSAKDVPFACKWLQKESPPSGICMSFPESRTVQYVLRETIWEERSPNSDQGMKEPSHCPKHELAQATPPHRYLY